MAAFGREPPTYQYFVFVWNRDCSHIKLKKAMRFTKCDVCTLANEALDVERRKGGAGWCTEAMEIIKRHLVDHNEASYAVPLRTHPPVDTVQASTDRNLIHDSTFTQKDK